jgi:hypothetical protein
VLSDVFASAAEWKRVLEQSRQDEDPRNRKRPTERKK